MSRERRHLEHPQGHRRGLCPRIGDRPPDTVLTEISAAVRDGDDLRYAKLSVATRFWEAWIAARDSNWTDNEGVELPRWSQLALQIVDDLAHDRDISDVICAIPFRFDLHSAVSKTAAGEHSSGAPLADCALADEAAGQNECSVFIIDCVRHKTGLLRSGRNVWNSGSRSST